MEKKPNVLLMILDACRADALPPSPHRETPLVRFLRRAVVVEDCQSTSSCTAVSIASLLTGVGPHVHGISTLVGATLAPGVHTIGTLFGAAGYTTGFFPSTAVLNRTTGLGKGFHLVDDSFLEPLYRDLAPGIPLDLPLFRRHFYQSPQARVLPGSLRFCEVTTESLVRWISRTPDPWLAVVHFLEPHYPYWPPSPWRVSEDPLAKENYLASLRFWEEVCLQRLVEVIQARGSPTVLILTSDHGEYWGTHGFRPTGDHGDLYQEVLHVPLVFWGFGADRLQETRHAPWSHLDVLPTLLGLVGLDGPRGLPGVDRTASCQERPRHSWEDVAFNDPDHVRATGGLRRGGVAVRYGRYKLIWRPCGLGPWELYDLETDPEETRNVVDLVPTVRDHLAGLLPPVPRASAGTVPELSQRLAALGYL